MRPCQHGAGSLRPDYTLHLTGHIGSLEGRPKNQAVLWDGQGCDPINQGVEVLTG